MGFRSRVHDGLTRVAKVFGNAVPPQIEAAEERAHMTPASPFSPGEPIGPYDGYSRTPRSREFVTGYNIAARPRSHERVAFETLKGLIDNYDVAQICIRHRIASLRSLDWKLIAAEGYEGDVSAEIAEGKRVLKRPDRKTLFKPWLAKYLRDVLSYDAGTLYRMRNRGGRPVGLKVVSGIQIAPLLDYWGDPPDAPAPAYVQYVQGLPWNWLTRDDLIYEPYDPQPDSIYGRAPLEDILLTANTDVRFQLYFLQRFTEGNLPAAFASAPETWSPEQIEQFQELWDGFMLGDQTRKHQIRWLPGGSKFTWSNEKNFDDHFSLFLMRKTCASFSVVPADLGFTESVNRSSGESQADVQHRVGDLPLAHHVQDILTAFLQDDLELPIRFIFDLGEEQDDRVNQAQADDIYMKMGVIGPSDIREMRYGLAEPEGRPVPRFIYTERAGPIPLSSLYAVAGEIDPATAAPQPGAPLPHEVFGGTEGVLPNPPIKVMSLAEREYGPSAMPPAPPPQPVLQAPEATDPQAGPVAKEGEGAPSGEGITSETGVYSYDGPGSDDEDEDREAQVAKELAAFRRFAKARRRDGEWRDFRFDAVPAGTARQLNAEGREAVAKAADARPKAPHAPDGRTWPGWALDLQTADHWAPKVTAAVTSALPPARARDMGRAYLTDHPHQDGQAKGKRDRNKAAAAWLLAWLAKQGITLIPAAIGQGIATDGYMIGAGSASSMVSGQDGADTGGWQPGDTGGAQQKLSELGLLATLLGILGGRDGDAAAAEEAGTGEAAETAADALTSGYAGSLAIILAGTDADWADSQETLDDLGAILSDSLADESLATTLVGTQIGIYTGLAAHAYYLANSVAWVSWLTMDDGRECPVCWANQEAGPVLLGQEFPSGHTGPPVHPRCAQRCAIVPASPPSGASGTGGLPSAGDDGAGAEAEAGEAEEVAGDEEATGAGEESAEGEEAEAGEEAAPEEAAEPAEPEAEPEPEPVPQPQEPAAPKEPPSPQPPAVQVPPVPEPEPVPEVPAPEPEGAEPEPEEAPESGGGEQEPEEESAEPAEDAGEAESGTEAEPGAEPEAAAGEQGPSLADLIPASDDEAAARYSEIVSAISGALEGEYAGLAVTADRDVFEVADGQVKASFVIRTADGQRAGEIVRVFGRDEDGVLYADHTLLELGKDVRGQGFAAAWNARLEQWYRDSGVEYISLHADIDVGGYAWASAGYGFADEEEAANILGYLETVAGELGDSPEDRREAEAAEAVLEAARTHEFGQPGYPTPFDISQIGRLPGQSGKDALWLGKRILLNSDWFGVKYL